ncbi:TetR/AcrR family transcriptional regulator [candidate division CSSED10-310 bacterium]|uniref:TetR/AcrR family transcriptional regulator n=1 Tax=candidate division CSSED10-310 bacterium TaxID=2855610 RepID=A0ABV6Z3D4_UNCC1
MRSSRQREIINLAKGLVLEKGFYAMSYQDLSDLLSITKASIHGHFRTKEKLGNAILECAIAEMVAYWETEHEAPRRQIERLLDNYEHMSHTRRNMCLVSVLQGEYDLLPATMQNLLNNYNRTYIQYAADALNRARQAGTMSFSEPARDKAISRAPS